MLKPRAISKTVQSIRSAHARGLKTQFPNVTARVVSPYAARRQLHFLRSVATVTTLGTIATAWQWYANGGISRDVHAEGQRLFPERPEIEAELERPRRKAISKEDNRALISSQHLQVKRSWENPGVYAWGSNIGKVAAPDSNETFVKTPRRISFFDGVLLRDVKLERLFGAAIDEDGNLHQWGTGFDPTGGNPTVTLQGKNLMSLALSRDRVLALSSSGRVYSVPMSREEQENGLRPSESSWIPFWSYKSNISYRSISPGKLGSGEQVVSIAGGLEHALLLTSKGRVFSVAPGTQDFPTKGQMGIPGLNWLTKPPGEHDQCHEITSLRGFDVQHIAAGDYHSLVADKEGRVFTFGDNSLGQLGADYSPETSAIDLPLLLPIQKLYAGTSQVPKVTGIAAGGANSYFTIDATKTAAPDASEPSASRNLGLVTADTWSCGQGIWGGLGNGKWTHVQSTPTKIPALSGLFEYDEQANKAVPIRLSRLSIGATHAAAVMDNVTYVNASSVSSENDTNWGADILFFGNNEFYQLGTGKRNNVSNPTYILPLDQVAERKARGKEEHRFQITPRKRVKINGRTVDLEQRVECGRGVTAVYSGV